MVYHLSKEVLTILLQNMNSFWIIILLWKTRTHFQSLILSWIFKKYAPPQNSKAQRKVFGLFPYYSKWISNFLEKITLLSGNIMFPLSRNALTAFQTLLKRYWKLCIQSNQGITFAFETDPSNCAIAATLIREKEQ